MTASRARTASIAIATRLRRDGIPHSSPVINHRSQAIGASALIARYDPLAFARILPEFTVELS